MAKISGKPKLPISNSDLKKAIVERNNSLEQRNKILAGMIKDREKEFKSLEQTYNSEAKKLTSLSKDVQFEEERVQKIKSGVYSSKKLLDGQLKKASKVEQELCEYESTVGKLEDKENKLLDSIVTLELYKSKCEESKTEFASIHVKKDNLLDELDSINSNIKVSVEEGKKKVTYFEDQYDDLEERAKKHEEMVEKEQANNELQAIKNLCNNSEDEYIKWEQKVAKAKDQADKEEERNKKAKEHFSKWKIGVLEEVAKLKLKSKVDKIDKAGLSDILNG
jgi:chromosome segregation ATPase